VSLEIARVFAETKDRPKALASVHLRCQEEEGLLGSDYFAQHPTVPAAQIAANINMDGISLFYDFKDLRVLASSMLYVVALGSDHSSLFKQVNDVAQHLHLEVSPDPMREENFFIRSAGVKGI
jgi:Zn-dependent M28 family amino/carboxypeptidase